jgi:hypothetical protein
LLVALDDLDNEGWLSIARGSTMSDVEAKASDLATRAVAVDAPQVKMSNYSLA